MDKKPESSQPFTAIIDGITPLSSDVAGIRFRLADRPMPFQAGQHVRLLIPVGGDIRMGYFSIASSPARRDRFEICVGFSKSGPILDFLRGLEVGQRLQLLGPFGSFVLPEKLEKEIVFVATGTGIAPIRSMIFDRLERESAYPLTLLYGNRTEDDILYRQDWERLAAQHSHFRVHLTLSRPRADWAGPKGYVQDLLARIVAEPFRKEYCLCGSKIMIQSVAEKLASYGVPPAQIHFE